MKKDKNNNNNNNENKNKWTEYESGKRYRIKILTRKTIWTQTKQKEDILKNIKGKKVNFNYYKSKDIKKENIAEKYFPFTFIRTLLISY